MKEKTHRWSKENVFIDGIIAMAGLMSSADTVISYPGLYECGARRSIRRSAIILRGYDRIVAARAAPRHRIAAHDASSRCAGRASIIWKLAYNGRDSHFYGAGPVFRCMTPARLFASPDPIR
jgi:hypothetical protein